MFGFRTPTSVALVAVLLWLVLSSPYCQSTSACQRARQSMPQPLRRLFASSPAPQQTSNTGSRGGGSGKRFTYGLSASYSAKGHRLDPERNVYTFDPHVRISRTATELRNHGSSTAKQDRQTRPQSGEDAFFISPVADSGTIAFGVVDGVGGWQDSGVDPADFAHGLCDYMAAASRAFPRGFNSTAEASPKEIMQLGYGRVEADASIKAGGSTACVATASPAGRLVVANLGDSGFVHLAPNAVRHVSEPQTHAFNTPFQLSKLPAKLLAQMALFQGGSRHFHDLPSDATLTHHAVRHGDVVVFATDGVWDNLSPSDALGIVGRVMEGAGAWIASRQSAGLDVDDAALRRLTSRRSRSGSGSGSGSGAHARADDVTAQLALAIVKEAKLAGLDKKRDGPFAREVQRYYPGERWHGGKPDDICAVVLVAVEEPEGPARSKL